MTLPAEVTAALLLPPGERTPAQHAAIVAACRPLVCYLAREKVRPGHDLQDLIQEGSIALWRAARDFDPRRCPHFSGYAGLLIKQRISVVQNRTRRSRISTGEPLGDLDVAAPATPAPRLDPGEIARIHRAIDALAPRERTILREHYLRGRSLRAVGFDLGVARQTASLAHVTALAKLRTALADLDEDR